MSNCNSCQIILTVDNRHLKMNKCRPCQRIRQDKLNLRATQRRLEESGLTEKEIAAILTKWELWYPNYVIHQKSQNSIHVRHEYTVELTVMMKRYLMKSWMTNMNRDFSLDNVVA